MNLNGTAAGWFESLWYALFRWWWNRQSQRYGVALDAEFPVDVDAAVRAGIPAIPALSIVARVVYDSREDACEDISGQ